MEGGNEVAACRRLKPFLFPPKTLCSAETATRDSVCLELATDIQLNKNTPFDNRSPENLFIFKKREVVLILDC